MSGLQHRGFEACITCDGDELAVHRPSVAGDTASGWIASTPGQAFTITVTQCKLETHFTLRVHLDGQRVEYLVTPNWQLRTLATAGARPSPATFTPFVFAAPSLPASDSEGEGEGEAPDEATLRGIGTIRLEVARVVLGAVYKTDRTQTGDLSPADVARKRALGQHHIALGDERPGPPWIMRKWSVRPVDPRKAGPTVVFEFRYRPREFLLANGIIPRPKRARELPLDNVLDEQRSAKVARLDEEDTSESAHAGDSASADTESTVDAGQSASTCDSYGFGGALASSCAAQSTERPHIPLSSTFNDPVPS